MLKADKLVFYFCAIHGFSNILTQGGSSAINYLEDQSSAQIVS
jgi:hypothetical protein